MSIKRPGGGIVVEKKRPLMDWETISEGHAYSLYDYDNLLDPSVEN